MSGISRQAKSSGANYTLGVLVVTSLVSFLDRQILALLVAPVRHDLAISDTQIGILQGLAFSLFYGAAAIPAGIIADRWSRRALIAAALTLWSAATICCGLAHSFNQLFLARLVVGLGEACLGPAALSIISDSYSPEVRGRAVGTYQMGIYFGVGGSLVLGGLVLALLKDAASVSLPGVGPVSSWRVVFYLVGAVGFLLVPILFTIREPPRRGDGLFGEPAATLGEDLRAFFHYLRGHWRIVLAVDLFYGLVAFFGNGIGAWVPSLYIRNFAFRPSTAGLEIGCITTVAGVAACFASGALGDRWLQRGVTGDRYRTSLIGCGLAALSLLIFPLTGILPLSLAFLALSLFANAFLVSTGPSVVGDLAPPRFRAKAMSLYFFGVAAIGNGLGPPAIGFVNDTVFHGGRLGWSIALAPLAAVMVGAALCFATLSAYDRARPEKKGSRIDSTACA